MAGDPKVDQQGLSYSPLRIRASCRCLQRGFRISFAGTRFERLFPGTFRDGILVEPVGIEPTTSSMPWKRSPS
jgi:hypothetical protein